MSTKQITPNGTNPSPNPADVVEIQVEYDQENDCVTVCPKEVCRGAKVRFKDPKGGKLRIVFLSAMGHETETVWDSDVCTLSVGGIFHFKCFFSYPGTKGEISPKIGGALGVNPPLP